MLVVAVLIATSFSVIGIAKGVTRAEMLSLISPQWMRYVSGAIDSGAIPDDATPFEVKDWLDGRIDGMSDKALSSYVNPKAAKVVSSNDAMSVSADSEPEPVTGTGQILVLLVEFTGTDEYKGITYEGPEHNSVDKPADDDNVVYWCEDFNTAHFEDLLFSSDGMTLKNYYEEQSGGLYTVDGYVSAWVQIGNHSEWWYGADSMSGGEGSDDLNGPTWRFAIDAALAAYMQYEDAIPWADFDTDGDGFIDSLMIVNAGVDQSAGGPAWAIWAHSWFVNEPYGFELPNGLKVGSYTTEPENEAVGVYAHEYGHQLGLPDEYDWTYTGEAPTGFLSLMASGSWGPGIAPDGRMVLGVSPCHLNVWGKYVLGWENGATAYYDFSGGDRVKARVNMLEIETPGSGIRAIKIELPAQMVDLGLPQQYTGEFQWWSGYRSDWTDVGELRYSSYEMTTPTPIAIPADGATLTFNEWYDIEKYYDFGFVEVSKDGVAWTSLPGQYTTDDNPYGGNEGNGITGTSHHYVTESMDLSGFAGSSIYLRFRMQQDPYTHGLGWVLDDISATDLDGNVLFEDLVDESSTDMWALTATDEGGPGWNVINGTQGAPVRHYYIMEWRNFVKFDSTLLTSYQFVDLTDPYNNDVEFWSHTPGLLIWYRNFLYEDNNVGQHPGYAGIGIVDAHPEPIYQDNDVMVRQRLLLMDATFGLRSTIANTIPFVGVDQEFPSLPAQPTFDDSGVFFYLDFEKGVTKFIGLELPTYGVKVSVLSEKSDLSGAKILVDLKALSA
jgi:immune inhibitor A